MSSPENNSVSKQTVSIIPDLPPPPPTDNSGNTVQPENCSSEPSHNMVGKYAALMETNDQECESWYYFIKVEGNEDNLNHLQKQLQKVEWYLMDDLSTFDLDTDHYVSAITAKEMTKVELNSYAFHRKFDGKLQKIDLDFKKKDSDETKMCKTFDMLGYGQIEDYIDDEDLDEEDLTDNDDTDSDSENDSDSCSDSSTSSDEEIKTKTIKNNNKNQKGIPPVLINSNLPRFAKAKRKGKKV